MRGKKVFWVGFTAVPVIGLWCYGLAATLKGYEAACGALSRGNKCTQWDYIDANLFSAFVAPGLIAVSVTWLLLVAIVAILVIVVRQRNQKDLARSS